MFDQRRHVFSVQPSVLRSHQWFSLVMSPNQLKQTLRSFIVQILLVLFLKVRKAMTDSTKIYEYLLKPSRLITRLLVN